MKIITMYSGPMCAFCYAAKRLLNRNNLEYKVIDVSTGPDLRDEMITILGVPGLINIKRIICRKRK